MTKFFNDYMINHEKTETGAMYAEAELALLGEAGEIVDAIKKLIFHDRDNSLENLKEELGDFFWYFCQFAKELNALQYLKELIKLMYIKTEIKESIDIQEEIKNQVETANYRFILRKFIESVFNLTKGKEGENPLISFKDGIPSPALKGLTNLQSLDMQNVLYVFLVILKKYANCSLEEILDINIKKTHERYEERLG